MAQTDSRAVSGCSRRAMVILNPGSGHAAPRTEQIHPQSDAQVPPAVQIEQHLRNEGIEPLLMPTHSAREATALARRCVDEGFDMVIAAGGDGTINAVANGLAGSNIPLGIIPLGTVNLFALELGVPDSIAEACRRIAVASPRRIDLGRAGDRFFTCLCGVGFDAFVISQADSRLKKRIGAAAYVFTACAYLLRYRFSTIRYVIDSDGVERKGYALMVCNGRYYSASMTIATKARIDDGLLDVISFKRRDLGGIIGYLWGLRTSTLPRHPTIDYHQCRSISVHRHGRHCIHADGEFLGKSPLDFCVEPHSLSVIA